VTRTSKEEIMIIIDLKKISNESKEKHFMENKKENVGNILGLSKETIEKILDDIINREKEEPKKNSKSFEDFLGETIANLLEKSDGYDCSEDSEEDCLCKIVPDCEEDSSFYEDEENCDEDCSYCAVDKIVEMRDHYLEEMYRAQIAVDVYEELLKELGYEEG